MATAIRRLVRGEDGIVQVVYVDLDTFKPVADLSGYSVLEPDNRIEDVQMGAIPSTAKPISDEPIPPEVTDTKGLEEYLARGNQNAGDGQTGLIAGNRDAVNDFGYKDKPMGLSLASMLPGPLGLAGKGVNAAMNANNMVARDKARGYLGLDPLGKLDKAKGVISDQGNVVSKSANIGGNEYQIGFGGVSEDGKHTQLTPDEARTRSLVLDAPVKEGSVSERGFSYRAPETPSAPESGTPGSLGQNYEHGATGTKQGLAGRVGGVTAAELGTVPDAATPDSMRSMPDISAPLSGSVTSSKGLLSQPTLGQPAPDPQRFGGITPSQTPSPSPALDTPTQTKVGDVIDVPEREEVSSPALGGPQAQMQSKMAPSESTNKALGFAPATPADKPSVANNFGYESTPERASSLASPSTAATPDKTSMSGYKASAVTSPASAIGQTREQAVKDAYDAAYGAGLTGLAADMSVAQAMHESAWGTQPAGTSNLHGIKSKTGTSVMTHEYVGGKRVNMAQKFANFVDPRESFAGWKSLMERNFPGVLAATTEEEALSALDNGRLGAYATDPKYKDKVKGYLDAVRSFNFENTGPASSTTVQDAKGIGHSVEDTYGSRPGKTTGLGQFTGQTKGSVKGNALTGSLGLGGGYVSDVGVSGVSKKDDVSPGNSPGGKTGFGARDSSLRDSISESARGGLGNSSADRGEKADGRKGQESYGSKKSEGSSKSAGAKGGRVGSGAFGGTASRSEKDKPDGRKGQESYGGSKSKSESTSKGSASSSKSDSRGGKSSGRGMGGFN